MSDAKETKVDGPREDDACLDVEEQQDEDHHDTTTEVTQKIRSPWKIYLAHALSTWGDRM